MNRWDKAENHDHSTRVRTVLRSLLIRLGCGGIDEPVGQSVESLKITTRIREHGVVRSLLIRLDCGRTDEPAENQKAGPVSVTVE